jgi:hypothetical protein
MSVTRAHVGSMGPPPGATTVSGAVTRTEVREWRARARSRRSTLSGSGKAHRSTSSTTSSRGAVSASTCSGPGTSAAVVAASSRKGAAPSSRAASASRSWSSSGSCPVCSRCSGTFACPASSNWTADSSSSRPQTRRAGCPSRAAVRASWVARMLRPAWRCPVMSHTASGTRPPVASSRADSPVRIVVAGSVLRAVSWRANTSMRSVMNASCGGGWTNSTGPRGRVVPSRGPRPPRATGPRPSVAMPTSWTAPSVTGRRPR